MRVRTTGRGYICSRSFRLVERGLPTPLEVHAESRLRERHDAAYLAVVVVSSVILPPRALLGIACQIGPSEVVPDRGAAYLRSRWGSRNAGTQA